MCSELQLWPNSVEALETADVEVVVDERVTAAPRGFRLESRDTATYIEGAGAVRVSDGRRIAIAPAPGVGADGQVVAATGAGLAMLLHQRGFCVLHGSCVAIAGRGVCLAGVSGAGKSTIATGLMQRGHALLSDGMTVLDPSGEAPLALVGPRAARLWPDAAARFGYDPDGLARVVAGFDKRVCPLSGPEPVEVPLESVIVIEDGVELELRALGPRDGLIALVKHAFLNEYVEPREAASLLSRLGEIAERVPVATLRRPSSLALLPAVLDACEAHLTRPH